MVLSKVSECKIQDQISKVKKGTSFAYLAFIEAMSFIPGSAYWSILFLLMYLSMGLTAMVGIMQGIITPLQDTFSFSRKHPKLLIVNVSVLMFLCSLFFAQPSGFYFFRLLNDYWINFPILFLITLENVAIAWSYGAKRIPFNSVNWFGSGMVSKSLILRSGKDARNQEILQGNKRNL
ncbi:orphan sodium- and chloride-dependent neurotransmitter transporter NTT5-like [Elephas maximus indicus]|uniref:orphan sodium- and chloride-dependent neurotransmitter transporter NTT5-like n=1 Tax=Elephas maximus indicus TaxID=99487 RepID=UPI0021172A9D|nr:orphan sodium- and chloride-dependent neurotransmitter transporter NTT5-like [Elephas maximus indicus]